MTGQSTFQPVCLTEDRGFAAILAITVLFIVITIILGMTDFFTYDMVGERLQETVDVGGPAAMAYALDRGALKDNLLMVDPVKAEEQFKQILRDNFNLDNSLTPLSDCFLKSPLRIIRFRLLQVNREQVQLEAAMTVDVYSQLFKRNRTLLIESKSTLDYHDV